MIQAFIGNIIQAETEAIILPSSQIGVSDYGTTGDIKSKIGEIGRSVMFNKNGKRLELGEFYVSGPGELKKKGVQKVYYAIISTVPLGYGNCQNIEKALRSILLDCVKNKIKSIAIPGLGIKNGIDKEVIAFTIMPILKDFCDKIEIKIMDQDKEFIDRIIFLMI